MIVTGFHIIQYKKHKKTRFSDYDLFISNSETRMFNTYIHTPLFHKKITVAYPETFKSSSTITACNKVIPSSLTPSVNQF